MEFTKMVIPVRLPDGFELQHPPISKTVMDLFYDKHIYHTTEKREDMAYNLVHKDQIEEIINFLERDNNYLQARYGATDSYTRGYGKAVELTIKRLERLIPAQPQPHEAWTIEVKRIGQEPYRVVALRTGYDSWESVNELFDDISDTYEVTPICKMIPEEN